MPVSFSRRRLAVFVVCLMSVAVPAVPAVAAAATPGPVTVRVEGGATTLVPRTAVTTTTAPIDKAGTSCPGTSMGGALQAVDPAWSGPVDPSFGQQVDVIKGEDHSFSTKTYWSLYVNGKAASAGACATELQPGDDVLIYAACAGATAKCFSGEPLVATAPAKVAPGVAFAINVTESATTYGGAPDFAATRTTGPSAGATVQGGGLTARTGADGKATLTATQRGPLSLLVTKPDQVRQAVTVCVTDGSDGFCDLPAGPGCQTNGRDGRCGTSDKTAPTATILGGLKDQARFTRANAPSTLRGVVAPDPAGIKAVRLRLTRTQGRSCSFLDGARERLVKAKACGAAHGRFFSIGDKADWSYLLPLRLPAGRYVLDVQAVDKAGNASKVGARGRGRDRVVFVVK